ncbi:MAG: cation:proton antiporter subunit C [Clostridia bacterium]|nr:cation:proton antiporter subunit C [Clostridia bacterium]MBR3703981.1 cation:proton antiporter subunit C [Oscillospiraceae bacterium]
MQNLFTNHFEVAAAILFVVGLLALVLHKNLIKKIIGLNIMDTAVFLLLTSGGYIAGKTAPIVTDPSIPATMEQFINPLPSGLVLTGIVVSVSVTAFSLALTYRLYQRFHTLDIDEILLRAKEGAQ